MAPWQAERIIDWLWLGTFGLWFIGGIVTKRTVGSHSDWQSRLAVWVVVLGWFLLLDRNLSGPLALQLMTPNDASAAAGLVLTGAGLGVAIWARLYLGRNWSGLIELKQDHQLIRSGPYGLVRHPIYSGFLLATLGTALVPGQMRGFVAFALILVAWGYKSRLEETFLIEQFGTEYERYRSQVKGLIPFVW